MRCIYNDDNNNVARMAGAVGKITVKQIIVYMNTWWIML